MPFSLGAFGYVTVVRVQLNDRILPMSQTVIISTKILNNHLTDPDWVVLDCRFSLAATDRGRQSYLQSHIPGASYVHLDEDLSAPVIAGQTGRHPLPLVDHLAEKFSTWGIGQGVQVVVYDDYPGASGAIAARLWWSLRYLGHDDVVLLDGGWAQWVNEVRPVMSGQETRSRKQFAPHPRAELLATSFEIERMQSKKDGLVIDSRSHDRYRGENETIDPVAGHIPGAISAPFTDNYGPDGLFLPAQKLNERFTNILGGVPPERAIFYCGSGVTAGVNMIALVHAGIGEAKLYVGSWSEWIADPRHPVSTGLG